MFQSKFRKVFELVAGALWFCAYSVEDFIAHHHDSKRDYH